MRWLCLLALASACRPVLEPRVDAPRGEPVERYEALLRDVVTEDGLVDWSRLAEERDALDEYVAWIARPKRVPRAVNQHAFWINAYNALVLYGALEDGPPASVMDVPGWLPVAGSGFFFERAFRVQGQPTSLTEIEHERLRGTVMDWRDHAALNCASRSCPPLRDELYDNGRLEAQLKDQVERWLSDPQRGVRVEGDVAVFSALFDWFAHDFELLDPGGDPCRLASRFTEGALSRDLARLSDQGCPRRFMTWDWTLNDARAGGREKNPPNEPASDK